MCPPGLPGIGTRGTCQVLHIYISGLLYVCIYIYIYITLHDIYLILYIHISNYIICIYVQAVCGDGIVLGEEACDDGGLHVGDGCSEKCTIEVLLI